MLVLFACLGVSLLAGLAAWAAARAWWRGVPGGAPQLRSHLDPQMATGSLLAIIGIAVVVGGGSLGILIAMIRLHTGFASFDASAARFGAKHATTVSTRVLRIVTQFGGAVVLVPITVVVGVVEGRRWRSWAPIEFLAVVIAGQYILADLIKLVVGRARPDILRLTGFSGPSFPSGHAAAAAAAFAAMALLVGRGRSWRSKTALAGIAVGATVLIGVSRVVLGVHWLTDVLAGFCLGWTWFAITSIAFGGRRLRFGAPIVGAEAATPDSRKLKTM